MNKVVGGDTLHAGPIKWTFLNSTKPKRNLTHKNSKIPDYRKSRNEKY